MLAGKEVTNIIFLFHQYHEPEVLQSTYRAVLVGRTRHVERVLLNLRQRVAYGYRHLHHHKHGQIVLEIAEPERASWPRPRHFSACTTPVPLLTPFMVDSPMAIPSSCMS